MNINNDVLPLLKSIGIPGFISGETATATEALCLLPTAELNKIPLLFLESSASSGDHAGIERHLENYRAQRKRAFDLMFTLDDLLGERGVRFALFKTLRPFPYMSSDIDLLLWSQEDLSVARQTLEKEGYVTLDRDAYGVTMYSTYHDLNVDMATEVAASGLVYLDKKTLLSEVTTVTRDGHSLTTLIPAADLVVATAHSFFKEQMCTLADYYTLVLSTQEIRQAMKLAERIHALLPLRIAAGVAYRVTADVFGPVEPILQKLREATGGKYERFHSGARFPFKYPPRMVLLGMVRKVMEDPETKRSLPIAMGAMLHAKFAKGILDHAVRSGY
jgi:hypothetical protein